MTIQPDSRLPVLRPKLPSVDRLVPYLRRLDETRQYTNFGPLLYEFEARLAAMIGVSPQCVVSSANGTLALTQALLALDIQPAAHCVMPSWTFAATPAAARSAGLTPYFADVDARSWELSLRSVEQLLGVADLGAVVPVSVFGRPIDVASWDEFAERTGVPVVIDAAAAFDAYTQGAAFPVGKSPLMISLHATKAFGIGEGAFVVTRDPILAHRIRMFGNFGFCGSRVAQIPGVNGKFSEYAAASGLASLDEWATVRGEWAELGRHYVAEFEGIEGVRLTPGYHAGWVSSYACVELTGPVDGDYLIGHLDRLGVEARRWWHSGCHLHPAYQHHPHTDLGVTNELARSVVGLPFWRGMKRQDVVRVREAVCHILQQDEPAQESPGAYRRAQ